MAGPTRYVSVKKIADGGMAEIFLATQSGAEGFTRPVIVKRILPGLSADPQFRDMLVDEAHIAMSLNHGNIVPVLDLGQSRGRYFLVMDLVDGWDLDTILRRTRKTGLALPLGAGLYMMAEVCRGLAYAHARKDATGRVLGIVHRDVSPHNVLLGEQGEVKLTDFGIAKALGKRGRTRTGVIKGKLDFMSPEQASGGALAPSSDIFAVGTILYLLAAGRRPFEGENDLQVLLKVQRAEFTPLDKRCPGVSPGVARIVSKAMKREPAARYQDGEAMMLDIEEVLRTEFRSPGRSELKRWLAELSSKDSVPCTSQLPALPVSEPLGPIGTGETDTANMENTATVSAFADTRMQDARDGKPRAPPAPPPLPAEAIPGSLAQVTPTPPPVTVRGPLPRRRRRRVPRSGLRAVVLLALLAGATVGAYHLVSPRTRAAVAERVRGLLDRTHPGKTASNGRTRTVTPAPRAGAAAPAEERPSRGDTDERPERAPVRNERAETPRRPEPRDQVTIRLVTRPAGASVVGRSGTLGRTPLPYTTRLGSSEVLRFAKTGYAATSRRITATAKTKTVVVDLRRKRR